MTDKTGAIVVETTGGPEVLQWRDTEVPDPGTGQVQVEVVAAGINFIDIYQRNGLYPLTLPFTPGVEGAGVVEAVGDDVGTLEVGSRVAWSGSLGSYTQHRVLDAADVVEVPENVHLDLAAAVMLQGMTAHYLCHDTYPLQPGDICLIHAGAGGVGNLLIQMAKMRGARVFATVGTAEKAEVAQAAGADHVINYADTDFKQAIEEIAGPKQLAVVYDGVGKDTFERGMELLGRRGVMVTFGNSSGPPPPIEALQLMRLGSLYVTRPTLFDYNATRDQLEQRSTALFRMIADGTLEVRIGARFPLSAAADAHRALQGRSTTGKVLLEA
ncbi:MAG: quinone oxidoreductase [Acidimicrobiia bacterium]|nr:quinone oxidoreductase [Acidimicrobiia bacterium]